MLSCFFVLLLLLLFFVFGLFVFRFRFCFYFLFLFFFLLFFWGGSVKSDFAQSAKVDRLTSLCSATAGAFCGLVRQPRLLRLLGHLLR